MIIDVEAWLTSICGVRSSMSRLDLLPGLWFDISPCFLTTLKQIANWVHLSSPVALFTVYIQFRGFKGIKVFPTSFDRGGMYMSP